MALPLRQTLARVTEDGVLAIGASKMQAKADSDHIEA
jgi:hypothetical protein